MDEDKLTDDDLKRHRVGGRLVTRKEILRSKKCSCDHAFGLACYSFNPSRQRTC